MIVYVVVAAAAVAAVVDDDDDDDVESYKYNVFCVFCALTNHSSCLCLL